LVEARRVELAARVPLRQHAGQRLVRGEEAVLRHQMQHVVQLAVRT
jgi:hypothetical protein